MAQLIFLCAGDEEVGNEWNEIFQLGLYLLKPKVILYFQFNGQNNMDLFTITCIITLALSAGKIARNIMIFIKIRFCKLIAIYCLG